MKNNTAIAHVRKNEDGTWAEPQSLTDHLEGTAKLALTFAECFGSSAWGYMVGIAHDIGKSPETWQRYLGNKNGYNEEAHLETKPGTKDHSTPSAKLAEEVLGKGVGRILSYCIAWIQMIFSYLVDADFLANESTKSE